MSFHLTPTDMDLMRQVLLLHPVAVQLDELPRLSRQDRCKLLAVVLVLLSRAVDDKNKALAAIRTSGLLERLRQETIQRRAEPAEAEAPLDFIPLPEAGANLARLAATVAGS